MPEPIAMANTKDRPTVLNAPIWRMLSARPERFGEVSVTLGVYSSKEAHK